MELPTTDICDEGRLRHDIDMEFSPLVQSEVLQVDDKSANRAEYVPKNRCYGYGGLILAVMSSLMFSVCSLLVKLISNVSEWELAMFRFAGILLPSVAILIYGKHAPYPKGFRMKLLMRGIFGTASLMLQFYAFRHMPLADASVIVFSIPAVVAVLARIFLKEPCGRFQVVLITLTICGVIIIARPPILFGSLAASYTTENWYGAMAAMLATVVAATALIFLRMLKTLHYSVVMTDFALIALFITPLATLIAGEASIPPCCITRWLIVLMAVLSFFGQIFLTKALQIEDAGPVAIARTSDVVFAFVWQAIFFGETPGLLTILGAFLVTSCIVLLGVRKWVMSLSESSPVRQRLSFIIS